MHRPHHVSSLWSREMLDHVTQVLCWQNGSGPEQRLVCSRVVVALAQCPRIGLDWIGSLLVDRMNLYVLVICSLNSWGGRTARD